MNTILQDIRFALRQLRKSPGFTVTAVLTLALGIGATTAIFSVVNGVLLNALPYPQTEQIVSVFQRKANFEKGAISYPNLQDWQRENHSFSAMAAYRNTGFSLTGTPDPAHFHGEMVSGNFFDIFGLKPLRGRVFRMDDDRQGSAPVALISEGMWKRKFASAPDIIGRSITLNGEDRTVVGIVPSSFNLRMNNFQNWKLNDVYIPIGQWNDPALRDRRRVMGMDAVGRLKPGVTIAQARDDMASVAHGLAVAYPDINQGMEVNLVPLRDEVVGGVRPALLVLLGAVCFVLLIACVNVANLLLARSTAREREFAVRVALGASRARVIKQLLTESVLLALAGGGLGLVLAQWGTRAALLAMPSDLPRVEEIGLDWHVLLFTALVSLFAGIVFGLAPALKTMRPAQEGLHSEGRGFSAARTRTQGTFVVIEMATALVLLVGAGLMVRSLARLWSVDPGFNPHNALAFEISPDPALHRQSPEAVRATLRAMNDKINTTPGIEAGSISYGATPLQDDSEDSFWIEGQPKPERDSEFGETLSYYVFPEYLKAMQVRLIKGRFISEQDDEHAAPVVVIDESFARKYFPNQDPIGRYINLQDGPAHLQIIGVVGHVKQFGLDDANFALHAQLYAPLLQTANEHMPHVAQAVNAVVRSAGAGTPLFNTIRHELAARDAQDVVYGEESYDDIVAHSIAQQRFAMMMLAVFAGLALLLASIGIYGVLAYLMEQRTREIGVRLALGAQREQVVALFLQQGLRWSVLGGIAGLAAALGLTRLMRSLLFEVAPYDPWIFTLVTVLLLMVAIAASWLPARRAASIDPMQALRNE